MAEAKKEKISDPEIQRLQPHSEELEQIVLGAMMLDEEAFGKAVDWLDGSNFYNSNHKLIFKAMISLFDKGIAIDPLTVAEELKSMQCLDEIGGAYYLSQLPNMVSSTVSVVHYAQILMKKSILRRLISVSGQTIDECFRPDADAHDMLDKAQERLFELALRGDRRGFEHIKPVMHNTMGMLEEFHKKKGKLMGLATGFTEIDDMTSGLQAGDLIIIAARPSMGKTAFALNIGFNVAHQEDAPVGIFSLEMSAQMLGYRMLCSAARIDSNDVRRGRLKPKEWAELAQYADALSKLQFYIDDTASLSVLELRARARRLVLEKNIKLLIVDYLQIMEPPAGEKNVVQAIAAQSRALKTLAKELHIPVIVLSQMSRAIMKRDEKTPQLSDLRDSGAIEQDADVVMFISRPVMEKIGDEDSMDEPDRRKAEIYISKQRNGPTGKINLVFNREYARFDNLEKSGGEPPIGPIGKDFEDVEDIADDDDDEAPF